MTKLLTLSYSIGIGFRIALWSVCCLLTYCDAYSSQQPQPSIAEIGKGLAVRPLSDSVRSAQRSTEVTITIRIVDAETNELVSGSRVGVTDEQTQRQLVAKSDSLGQKTFVVATTGGSVVILASAPGYTSVKTRLANVIASRQITLRLPAFKPSILTIKVFSGNIRQPLSSAVVTITSRHTGRTDRFDLPNGRLERRFTAPDELDIHVSATGHTSVSRHLIIDVPPSGKAFELDAELDKLVNDLILRAVDSQTNQPIAGARFALVSQADKLPVVLSVDSALGKATASVTKKTMYQLTVTAIGYNAHTQSLTVGDDQKEVVSRLIVGNTKPASSAAVITRTDTNAVAATSPGLSATRPFGRVEKGKRIALNRLYFDQSSPVLRPESYAELDQLVELLTQNPLLQIEIRGHTDNQGDFNLNTRLSVDRCRAVIDYLIRKGIQSDRLKAVGRGSLDPVAPNTREENRKKNRRVEFIML